MCQPTHKYNIMLPCTCVLYMYMSSDVQRTTTYIHHKLHTAINTYGCSCQPFWCLAVEMWERWLSLSRHLLTHTRSNSTSPSQLTAKYLTNEQTATGWCVNEEKKPCSSTGQWRHTPGHTHLQHAAACYIHWTYFSLASGSRVEEYLYSCREIPSHRTRPMERNVL